MVQGIENYEKIYYCIKALSIDRYTEINALQIKVFPLSHSAPLDAESLVQLVTRARKLYQYQLNVILSWLCDTLYELCETYSELNETCSQLNETLFQLYQVEWQRALFQQAQSVVTQQNTDVRNQNFEQSDEIITTASSMSCRWNHLAALTAAAWLLSLYFQPHLFLPAPHIKSQLFLILHYNFKFTNSIV